MRILVSASTFPLAEGDGLPRFVFDLAQALAEHARVFALAPDAPGARRSERMGGVEVRRYTYFRPRRLQALAYGHGMRENLRASAWARLQPPALVAAGARATRALVRDEVIELVNSHWIVPQGLATALARGRRPRFRHVLTVHAGDVYLLRRLPFGRALARFVLARSDGVLAVGSHVRESLDALLGRPSRAELQPMGADTALFRGGPEAAREPSPFPAGHLVFTGRFAEKKGAVHLLRALPRVRERHPGLGLVLIGYGPLEAELRGEAERLGLAPAVCFAGRLGHAGIARWLRGCRAAVVPSVVDRFGETEGMPTVVVEAMAAGARVVGSDVDGIPDVLRHGESGWLARPGDPADLAEKILLALAEPEGSPLLRRSREAASELDWSRVARRYAEVFARVLGDRAA
jgi:glycosyltransferase involved in cell wall biosynthesis